MSYYSSTLISIVVFIAAIGATYSSRASESDSIWFVPSNEYIVETLGSGEKKPLRLARHVIDSGLSYENFLIIEYSDHMILMKWERQQSEKTATLKVQRKYEKLKDLVNIADYEGLMRQVVEFFDSTESTRWGERDFDDGAEETLSLYVDGNWNTFHAIYFDKKPPAPFVGLTESFRAFKKKCLP